MNEWVGVESGKEEDLSEKDINAVFFLGLKKDIKNNEDLTEKSKKKKKFQRYTTFEKNKC